MISNTPHILSLLFWLSLLGSVTGVASYALFRGIERLSPRFLFFFELGCLFILFLWNTSDTPSLVIFLLFGVVPVLPALLGGWFHRRSGGHTHDGFQSFALCYSSIVLNLVLNVWLVSSDNSFIAYHLGPFTYGMGSSMALIALIYGLGVITYPVLAPLALWIWQSLRIRPGIDEARDDATSDGEGEGDPSSSY